MNKSGRLDNLNIEEGIGMDKSSVYRTNIVGGSEVVAISVDMDKSAIHETNSLFWDTKGNDVLGATALPFLWGICLRRKMPVF
jgi:hypothetical protein